jgi:hypothetical protein
VLQKIERFMELDRGGRGVRIAKLPELSSATFHSGKGEESRTIMADIPHIVLDEPFRGMKAMEPEYECFCRHLARFRSTAQELESGERWNSIGR